MSILLTRKRTYTAAEDKTDGALLFSADHTTASRALRECYSGIIQISAGATTAMPTVNMTNIRYIYIESNDTIEIKINGADSLTVQPLVLTGLAVFEADINCTSVSVKNPGGVDVRIRVFLAADTV